MARLLHDRLAFASYKAHHGQENMSLDDVEASLDITINHRQLNRNSLTSTHDGYANDATNSQIFKLANECSLRSDSPQCPASQSRREFQGRRLRSQSNAPRNGKYRSCSWKSAHKLPESSPLQHIRDSSYMDQESSFISRESDACVMPNTLPAAVGLEGFRTSRPEDIQDSEIHAPSQTPPRTPDMESQDQIVVNAVTPLHSTLQGEEGADLLLYLATSPAPAVKIAGRNSPSLSTPPPRNSQGQMSDLDPKPLSNHAPNTPGQNFNFADFVNITPSPATGRLSCRAANLTKATCIGREAHRKLNFDALMPSRNYATSLQSTTNQGHVLEQRIVELEGAFTSS